MRWLPSLLLATTGLAHAQPTPPPPPDAPPPVEPSPAPTPVVEPAPVEPSPAPTPVVEPVPAAAAADDDDDISPLVPSWEPTLMDKHAVGKIAFKPGKGLVATSEDGRFEVGIKVRAQVLGTLEHAPDETTSGTQIRRARVAFQGHMYGAHNKYKMELAVSPRDAFMRDDSVGTAPLLDWYMTFDYLKAATLVVGQYKVPFSRQRVVSSGSLQMVDRSIVQGEFNLDRNVGFDVRSTSLLDDRFHYYLGFYAGEGRNAFQLREQNFIYLARAEFQPFGDFEDYVEADFERTGPRLAIAASYAYVKDSLRDRGPLGSAPEDEGTTSFHTAEADVLLKAYGFSLTGELFWRDGERTGGGAVDEMGMAIPVVPPRNGLGFFGQAGYLLPRSAFEVSARYGQIIAADSDTSLGDDHEAGVGVSYYFGQHAFKLQADYFRLWDDAGFGDGTDQVRVQLEAGL